MRHLLCATLVLLASSCATAPASLSPPGSLQLTRAPGGAEREGNDWCSDVIPPNRFPGHDVLVNGKLFDALQVGVRVLWEIKTDNFDTYSPFLKKQVVRKQILKLRRERDLAADCGYGFVVGVSSAAHKAALKAAARDLEIVVTGCKPSPRDESNE